MRKDAGFDYGALVSAAGGVPPVRVGARAWVVGISLEGERRGAFLEKFPAGIVYTIEFEDGDATDVHESHHSRGVVDSTGLTFGEWI